MPIVGVSKRKTGLRNPVTVEVPYLASLFTHSELLVLSPGCTASNVTWIAAGPIQFYHVKDARYSQNWKNNRENRFRKGRNQESSRIQAQEPKFSDNGHVMKDAVASLHLSVSAQLLIIQ
ncbi:Protein sel-12 [Manis javanica]|nr:Protein sel-12 [Manis javanica]